MQPVSPVRISRKKYTEREYAAGTAGIADPYSGENTPVRQKNFWRNPVFRRMLFPSR